MRAAGVDVTVGVGEASSRAMNAAFLTHVATGRPLVTLKTASTLDGQIATSTGDSRWITSPASRTLVHRWRSEMDAVLVGSGTARADDPSLTVRDVALEDGQAQPLRVVLDRTGSLSPSLKLFDGSVPTLAVTGLEADPSYRHNLLDNGAAVLEVETVDGHLDLGAVLDALGAGAGLPGGVRAVQSVLVEAGPGLATALLRQNLVDRLRWFVAPKLVGRGTPALGDLEVATMADALEAGDAVWEPIGPDVLLRASLRT